MAEKEGTIMSIIVRLILILGSFITFIYIVHKLRDEDLRVEDVFYWLTFTVVIFLMSVFPEAVIQFAELIGIASTVNFVYLVIIFFLILRCFFLTVRVSRLEISIKKIIEEYALRENMEKEARYEDGI